MKRVLFVDTHLGSGSDDFFLSLGSHPRVQAVECGVYNDAGDVQRLLSSPHKSDTSAAVYADRLFHNYSVGTRWLPPVYHVYFVREPRGTLGEVIAGGYGAEQALSYYAFRLRRLCVLAARTGGVLLTHGDVGRGLDLVEGMLNLKPGLVVVPGSPSLASPVPLALVDRGAEAFERALYSLRNCGLRSVAEKDVAGGAVG